MAQPSGTYDDAVTLIPVRGLPEVHEGDDVGALIVRGLSRVGLTIRDGDVLAVTSKVVSKAEGLVAAASDATARAALVLRESERVVTERATSTGITRVVTAHAGPVMAGAGIDASNTGGAELLLLPHDPDASARRIHEQVLAAHGAPVRIGVLLTDTAGRPWRAGLIDLALGISGLQALDDLRGRTDADGRDLSVTIRCLADEIAAATDLVKGKVDGVPLALVRGLGHLVHPSGDTARSLVRSGPEDWFSLGRVEAIRDALGVPPGSPASEQVGLASVHPEAVDAVLQRVVRLALAGEHGVDASVTDDRVRLRCEDPVRLGRVWARLEVALAADDLRAEENQHHDGSLTLRATSR